jgi:hypothetical protein
MEEKLYFSPAEFPEKNDTAAIQAAVDAAKNQDVCVVAIHPKADGTAWHLDAPIRLPSGITVILDGATLEAGGVAFENEAPGTEQNKIFLLGRHGGAIRCTSDAPAIRFFNCRDCRVADLTVEGGKGIDLSFFRYSKLQQLKFQNCTHAVLFREGCNNIILESIHASTQQEAILTWGGSGTLMGRNPTIYNSIFCRIWTKTQGAPAVSLQAGQVALYNIVLRDVTDETQAPGQSVVLSDARDMTVRGVKTQRNAVGTLKSCDGLFISNLQCQGRPVLMEAENTRFLLDDETMDIVLPQFPEEKPDRPFLTPNDPQLLGETDGQSIQNAVNAAQSRGIGLVVIPRWNVRRQQALWDIEKAVRIPSNMTVVFLHAYLRQADFCCENMFINSRAYESEGRCLAHEEHDMAFIGIGDAVLDGGEPNGLLEKTCNLYGLPDKRHNATVLFNNVRNLVLENFQIRQSRWYCTYFIHCDTCRISNLDFDNWEDCCNRDGVDIRSGCHNFLVENITGTTGDDTVALNNLGNDGNDGRYVEGKDPDTLHMVIRNIKADAGRWFTVRLLCQDRHLEQDFVLDTIMDVAESENQKGVNATVVVGSHEYHYKIRAELGDLAHLTIRDLYGRGRRVLAFGGCSDDISASNIHGYGDNSAAISVFRRAKTRDVRIKGVYYSTEQKRLFATDSPVDSWEGIVVDLTNLETQKMSVSHVYARNARLGVCVTGNANVCVEDFSMEEASHMQTLCGSNCTLTVNGKEVPQTTVIPLC